MQLRLPIAVLLFLSISGMVHSGLLNNQPTVSPRPQSQTPISPTLPPGQLSRDGVSSTAISLVWGALDVQAGTKIQIQYSRTGLAGPFTVADAIIMKGDTAFVGNLTAGATYWWRLAVSSGQPLGKPATNTIKVDQPSAASLHVSLFDLTTIKVEWDNGATYGGAVAFDSYELMMSGRGSPFGLFSTVHTSNNTTASVVIDTAIQDVMNYTFYLRTIDKCNSCVTAARSVSQSKDYSILTPVYADVFASAGVIDLGQTVRLDCDPGYGSYVWMFGDGPMVEFDASTIDHKYNAPGNYRVQCGVISFGPDPGFKIVTDSYPILVIVNPRLQIEQPTATPYSMMNVGENVTFTTHAAGGTRQYLYNWTQLPTGCVSSNKANVTCHLTSAGSFAVTANVMDSLRVNATSLALGFSVQPTASITSFIASPSSLKTGEKTTLAVLTSGGTTPFTYAYSGLPSGCTSSNSATISCTPSIAGLFHVSITATDHTDQKVSSTLLLDVTLAPNSNPVPSSQPSTTSPLALANNSGLIMGIIIGLIAIVAIAGLLLLRGKHVI